MSKTKKIEREFQLTDDSVNCYDFRLLTAGYQQNEFEKNPIGYYMHEREGGVLLKWTDFRTEGDKVFAKPVINLSHARGAQVVEEIENGFLNAASVGHIVALEISTDPADKLPNQKGPTVTKWYNRECSLVDIPGNFNSLALVDANDNPINLADFNEPKPNPKMKELTFTVAQLAAMNLSATAQPLEVEKAFNDLVAKAARADEAEKALNDLKAATTAMEVENLVASATKEGKLTVELGTKLKANFAENPAGLKDLLDAMPKYKTIADTLADNPEKKKLADLMAKSYDDLFKEGKLADLKALDEKAFEAKRVEKFGTKK